MLYPACAQRAHSDVTVSPLPAGTPAQVLAPVQPVHGGFVEILSPTTILQTQFHPDSVFGARLKWAVFVRGSPGWYAKRLQIETGEIRPGFLGWTFRTGGYAYSLAHDGSHTLLVDTQLIDLRAHTIVFVALADSGGVNRVDVGGHVEFTTQALDPAPKLLDRLPGGRAFAGLEQ